MKSHVAMMRISNISSIEGRITRTGKKNNVVSPPNNRVTSEMFSNIEKPAAMASMGHTTIAPNVIRKKELDVITFPRKPSILNDSSAYLGIDRLFVRIGNELHVFGWR